MITHRPEEELVALGARYRAICISAQGHHTLGLLRTDAPVQAVVTRPFLDEFAGVLDRIDTALGDPETAAAEAAEPGVALGDRIERAKIWRRTMVGRAKAATTLEIDVPAGLARAQDGKEVPDLAADLLRMVALAQPELDRLFAAGITPALLEQGREHAKALAGIDRSSDRARLAALPAPVRALHRDKGRIYLGAKQINLLAHSVHAEDSRSRRSYNLDVLYRHVRAGVVDHPEGAAVSPGPSGRKGRR